MEGLLEPHFLSIELTLYCQRALANIRQSLTLSLNSTSYRACFSVAYNAADNTFSQAQTINSAI